MEDERYNLEKAKEEAAKLQQKLRSGDASNYSDAEKLNDAEEKQNQQEFSPELREVLESRQKIMPTDNLHETTSVDGVVYDVHKMYEYAETLPVLSVETAKFKDALGVEHKYWLDRKGGMLGPYDLLQDWPSALKNPDWADHIATIMLSNKDATIWIYGKTGLVFNGIHRLTKAVLDGENKIKAQIFETLPEDAKTGEINRSFVKDADVQELIREVAQSIFETREGIQNQAIVELFGLDDINDLAPNEIDEVKKFVRFAGIKYIGASVLMPVPETKTKEQVIALLKKAREEGYAESHGIIPGHDIAHMIVAFSLRGKEGRPAFLQSQTNNAGVDQSPQILFEELPAHLWGAFREGSLFQILLDENKRASWFEFIKENVRLNPYGDERVAEIQKILETIDTSTFISALEAYEKVIEELFIDTDVNSYVSFYGHDPAQISIIVKNRREAYENIKTNRNPKYIEMAEFMYINRKNPRAGYELFKNLCGPMIEEGNKS